MYFYSPSNQREEGKFAICKACGNQSADYDICDSCKRPLPEDAKLYEPDPPTATARKKPRIEGPPGATTVQTAKGGAAVVKGIGIATGSTSVTSTSAGDSSTSGSGSESSAGDDKKLFYGALNSTSATSSSQVSDGLISYVTCIA